jgi:hypothetical protein
MQFAANDNEAEVGSRAQAPLSQAQNIEIVQRPTESQESDGKGMNIIAQIGALS